MIGWNAQTLAVTNKRDIYALTAVNRLRKVVFGGSVFFVVVGFPPPRSGG